MPLPIIANCYRVALNWTNTQNALTATNVMHFAKSGGSASALYTLLNASVTQSMWIPTSTYASVNQVVITPLDGTGVSVPNLTGKPSKWSGAGTPADFNPQVSAIIKMQTVKRGRSYRGRVFLPWVAEGEQTNGVLTAGDVTTCSAAWTTWLAAMTAGGYNPVVASYLHATSENVVNVLCESLTATQRRRQHR